MCHSSEELKRMPWSGTHVASLSSMEERSMGLCSVFCTTGAEHFVTASFWGKVYTLSFWIKINMWNSFLVVHHYFSCLNHTKSCPHNGLGLTRQGEQKGGKWLRRSLAVQWQHHVLRMAGKPSMPHAQSPLYNLLATHCITLAEGRTVEACLKYAKQTYSSLTTSWLEQASHRRCTHTSESCCSRVPGLHAMWYRCTSSMFFTALFTYRGFRRGRGMFHIACRVQEAHKCILRLIHGPQMYCPKRKEKKIYYWMNIGLPGAPMGLQKHEK